MVLHLADLWATGVPLAYKQALCGKESMKRERAEEPAPKKPSAGDEMQSELSKVSQSVLIGYGCKHCSPNLRLDFRRSLVSGLPSPCSGEERGLISRTAAGNRA